MNPTAAVLSRPAAAEDPVVAGHLDSFRERLATDGIADGWKTVYSRLITPLADYLDRDDSTLGELPFLTHFPVKAGDRWASVPLELVRDRETFWFSDSQQLPREDRDGSWEGPWVVETPTVGRGATLAAALDCEFRTQADDRPQLAATRLDAAPHTEVDERLARKLRDRRPLILAALSAETSETFQPDHREDLEMAIDHIRSVPETVFERYRERFSLQGSRFGEHSAVYLLTEGKTGTGSDRYGLAYNAAAVDHDDPDPTTSPRRFRCCSNGHARRSCALPWPVKRRCSPQTSTSTPSGAPSARGQPTPSGPTSRALPPCWTPAASRSTSSGCWPNYDHLAETESDAYSVRTDIRQAIGDGATNPGPVEPLITAARSVPEPIVEMLHTLLSARPALDEGCPCTILVETAIDPETFVTWADTHHPAYEKHHPLQKEQAHRLEKVSRVWLNADEESRWTDLRDVPVWQEGTDQQPAEWSWTNPPFAYRLLDADTVNPEDDCWLTLGPATLDDLSEAVLTTICDDESSDGGPNRDDGPAGERALRRSLRQYLEMGSFPRGHDSPSAEKTHTRRVRERAFETIRAAPIRFGSDADTDVGGRIQSRGASYGSGGGSELTDRPEFAEEVIFASICTQLQTWAQETDGLQPRLGDQLASIVDESGPCPWHNPGRCRDLDRLERTPTRLARHLLEVIEADRTTRPEDPPRLAFVAADERGPGYDILDITGRVAGTVSDEAIQPTPVEVKAVTGDAPYTVRFTVNEFRQALTFVRNDVPYRIQLVRIEGGDVDSLDATSITPGPGVTFRSTADLYAYLPDLDLPVTEDVPDDAVHSIVATTFERTIRGGYLRITFG